MSAKMTYRSASSIIDCVKKVSIALVLTMFHGPCVADSLAGSVAMTVRGVNEGARPRIEFELKYDGDGKVMVHGASLPGRRAKDFVAFHVEKFKVIRDGESSVAACPDFVESVYIDDPSPGTEVLLKGYAYKASIDLSDVYTNIQSVLLSCDVVFFWNYRLAAVPPYEAERVAGAVVFYSDGGVFSQKEDYAFGLRRGKKEKK